MVSRRNIYLFINIVYIVVLALLPATPAFADELVERPLVLTELQTGGQTAGQEFIELYNTTDSEIDLADTGGSAQRTWKLQYFSGTKVTAINFDWLTTTPSGTISLTGKIGPHEYYLLATTGYVPGSTDPDQTFSPHFANEAGGIRLVSVNTVDKLITGHDQFRWRTTTTDNESSDFGAPHSQYGSWQRKLNLDEKYVTDTGLFVTLEDTVDISPKAAWQPTEAELEPNPADDAPVTPGPAPETTSPDEELPADDAPAADEPTVPPADDVEIVPLLPIQISELLPNPAAPETDDVNEFVELYNPNDIAVSVDGYIIEAGLSNSYRYRIADTVIPAFGYIVVTSGGSNLSLANSGGHARLLNAHGVVISISDDYSDAPSGESWSLLNAAWQWTKTPTPLLGNILTQAPAPAPKVVAAKKAAAKTTTKKAAAKPAVKASTTSKKAPAVKAAAAQSATVTGAEEESAPTIHASVLAAAGLLAVAYAAYEYRRDIANRLYQFRRYRAARRAARTGTSGR